MITAVDSNILFDVLLPDPQHGPSSLVLLKRASGEGALVLCEIVYAELSSLFDQEKSVAQTLGALGIALKSSSPTALHEAGRLWRIYRKRQRTVSVPPRVVADFLIGAHARHHADRLLTRDRGFFRDYFKGLPILQ